MLTFNISCVILPFNQLSDANQRFEFRDVQRLNTNDAYADAFLLANDNNETDALLQVEKALQFRRESGINSE